MEKIEKMMESFELKLDSIYPVLKPGDWIGIKQGAIYVDLFPGKENEAPTMVFGIGQSLSTHTVFLSPDLIGENTEKGIIQQAFINLLSYKAPGPADPLKVEGGKIITASGCDYGSEKILDPQYMKKFHKALGDKQIVVSIPRRTCFMACSMKDFKREEFANTFFKLHFDAWGDASKGNAPITQSLFVIDDGTIANRIELSVQPE